MKSVPAKPRTQLDRNGWIDGAFEALAEEGLPGMRVEALAKRFGVTKGSFYWHFKDRQDLYGAMLQTWKEGRIRDIDKQSAIPAGNEGEQLEQIIDVYSANRNRKGIAIELAVRDWARREIYRILHERQPDAKAQRLGTQDWRYSRMALRTWK